MRWQLLFDDLEAQLDRQEFSDLAAEVAERVRAERATIGLAERLMAHGGLDLRLTLTDGEVSGRVIDVAPQWLLLEEGPAQVLVPTTALVAVRGLGRAVAPEPGVVLRRLGLGHALRALARDRTPVAVCAAGSVLTGTIDRVGSDHLDLAVHAPGEPRRAGAVSAVLAVAFAQIQAVRSSAQ